MGAYAPLTADDVGSLPSSTDAKSETFSSLGEAIIDISNLKNKKMQRNKKCLQKM